jgi:hypothetical protein
MKVDNVVPSIAICKVMAISVKGAVAGENRFITSNLTNQSPSMYSLTRWQKLLPSTSDHSGSIAVGILSKKHLS